MDDFNPAGRRGRAKQVEAEVIDKNDQAELDEGARRIEEIRARRAQRGPISDGPSMKLAVPEDKKV
jgi:hypothetical protein